MTGSTPGSGPARGAAPTTTPASRAVAVLPVRGGELPVGGVAAVAQTHGRVWLLGPDPESAVPHLAGVATEVLLVEVATFDPPALALALARLAADGTAGDPGHILLPHSPDGRDLAPHLALALARPLVSAAAELTAETATVAGHGGRTMTCLALDGPVVATYQVGARAHPHPDPELAMTVERAAVPLTVLGPDDRSGGNGRAAGPGRGRVEQIEELPADPTTVDLAEATRIVAAGAGLGDRAAVADLEALAGRLSASVGATRVVTDWGWLPPERQIGTTGVTVDPDLYLAVGISGAVQHTAGLGTPEHAIVVNTDPSCPMMDLADLGLVCDGPAFVTELLAALDRPQP